MELGEKVFKVMCSRLRGYFKKHLRLQRVEVIIVELEWQCKQLEERIGEGLTLRPVISSGVAGGGGGSGGGLESALDRAAERAEDALERLEERLVETRMRLDDLLEERDGLRRETVEIEFALSTLPKDDAVLIRKRFDLGLSDRQAAQSLHCGATTVRRRVREIVCNLAEVLGEPVTEN